MSVQSPQGALKAVTSVQVISLGQVSIMQPVRHASTYSVGRLAGQGEVAMSLQAFTSSTVSIHTLSIMGLPVAEVEWLDVVELPPLVERSGAQKGPRVMSAAVASRVRARRMGGV